jgi:hypothetical protein
MTAFSRQLASLPRAEIGLIDDVTTNDHEIVQKSTVRIEEEEVKEN